MMQPQRAQIIAEGAKMKKRGQSTIEYALLIAIVAAAFMAMNVYVQRAVKANFNVIEEQVNAAP